MFVYTTNAHLLDDDMLDIIKDDLNVKKIQFIIDTAKYITFELKPQLKTLGPKYGKLLGGIREYLANCDSSSVVNKLNTGKTENFVINGEKISLTLDDVLINVVSKPDYKAQSFGGMTVILDTVLTKDLLDEGIMREVVSKLQSMRKESGYQVEDKINFFFEGDEEIVEIIQKFEKVIKTNVVINKMICGKGGENVKELEVNGKVINLGIERI